MADSVITKQELIDAQKDAQILEEVINGEPGKLVKTRLNRMVYTLASVPQINTMTREEVTAALTPKANKVDVDTALSNLSTTANKYYSTLASANADIANITLNQSVTIGEEANSGLWEKKTAGATTLTKSAYDPITLLNANPKVKSRWLVNGEDVNNLAEGNYYFTSTVAATLLNLPADEITNPDSGLIVCERAPNGTLPYQKIIRYTEVGGYLEKLERVSTGGSTVVWLPWRKIVSLKDTNNLELKINEKPNINCFKNISLSSDGANLYQATLQTDSDGTSVAVMDTSLLSSIFYDYEIDGRIFVAGQSISFDVNIFTDAIGPSGGDISILAYKADGSTTGATVTTRGSKINQWEQIRATLTLPVDAVKFRLRLIRRTGNTVVKFKKPLLTSSAWEATFIKAFQTANTVAASNHFFVSKAGSNLNAGTKAFPKLTIQAAIDALILTGSSGRITILDSGWYREAVTVSTDILVEILSDRGKRAAIVGSTQLVVSKTAGYSKVYQAPLAAKPVGMGAPRGLPMIFEWGAQSSQILDEDIHSLQRGESYRLPYTPMLEAISLAELDTISGNGKWWWESGIIYFSATDGSDATAKQYEARARACLSHTGGSIKLERIDSLFSNTYGMNFNGASTTRQDCRVFGAYHNGFADNANSTMSRRDMAVQNGNDGFNGTVVAYEGTQNSETSISADYFSPYGALNGDDGISFHIRGTCNIFGGLFEYNTKAGVVHVTGGGGNCFGTIVRGQNYGFYTATAAPDGRNKSSMHCHNTISEKCNYDYAAVDADLTCIGTYSTSPAIFGYYQTGTGKIVCEDTKYRGDPSKMKSGNVIVETYQQVT